MYSWKTIRTLCVILIMIPIVHLILLVSRDTIALLDPSPDAWSRELEAYIREDMGKTLPASPVVVVGGRRVTLWRGLERQLAPTPVLMRGLGDATLEDIAHHYERLVGYYRPDTLVVLPSNSEFHIRNSKSAEEFVAAAQSLVELDRAHGITRHFILITPLKSPLFYQDHDKIDRIKSSLAQWSQGQGGFVLLDANPMLARGNGRPAAEFFRSDGINLNEAGYLRLAMLLQAEIDSRVP